MSLAQELNTQGLLQDIRILIDEARQKVATIVNTEITLLYWSIGTRIRTEILHEKRAEYGQQIVQAVSAQLTTQYGKNFGRTNLFNMARFAEVYPDPQIVHSLRRQLSWTHIRELIYIEDPLKRDFYTELCRIENWSTRTLHDKINSMLYERTALSKKPEQLIAAELSELREENRLTPDMVFRDPYFLDFLGLHDSYSEKDLESAILHEMEKFILELGVGFTFVERQKRMTIGDDDFYLDLLFYHRKLKRLVAIELKLGKFEAAHKGQMELYLRWLNKYEKEPHEEAPIGLILCARKSEEQIELLELDQGGIRVASYLTELPERSILEKKLHDAIAQARARIGLSTGLLQEF